MLRRFLIRIPVFAALILASRLCAAPTSAETLFYSGDPDPALGLTGDIFAHVQTGYATSMVFQPFVVGDPTGWHVSEVWGTVFLNFSPSRAVWSIRSGMGPQQPGDLIAGDTSATVVEPAGVPSRWGHPELLKVTDLSVDLAPGTYWLQISPVGRYYDDSGRIVDEGADFKQSFGANAVNRAPAEAGRSLFYQNTPDSGVNYVDMGRDYSLGVAGTRGASTVPEPSTALLLLAAMGALAIAQCGRTLRPRC